MTIKKFNRLKKEAQTMPLSPFAQFCIDSKGYVFKNRRGMQLDKWEVFCLGYKNMGNIIAGNTKITAMIKE